MAVLVDYRCSDCGRDSEHWITGPVPAQAECVWCRAYARRRFGGALLRRAQPAQVVRDPGHACTPEIPGSCTLVPTAARMLAARGRGDNKAIDRESERQSRAIANGTLDPTGPLQTLFAGGPTASR